MSLRHVPPGCHLQGEMKAYGILPPCRVDGTPRIFASSNVKNLHIGAIRLPENEGLSYLRQYPRMQKKAYVQY